MRPKRGQANISSNDVLHSVAAICPVRRHEAKDEGPMVAEDPLRLLEDYGDSDAESAIALPARSAPGGAALRKNERCPYTGRLVRKG